MDGPEIEKVSNDKERCFFGLSDIDDSDGIIIVYDSLITASLSLLIKEIGKGQEGIRRTDHKFDVN